MGGETNRNGTVDLAPKAASPERAAQTLAWGEATNGSENPGQHKRKAGALKARILSHP